MPFNPHVFLTPEIPVMTELPTNLYKNERLSEEITFGHLK